MPIEVSLKNPPHLSSGAKTGSISRPAKPRFGRSGWSWCPFWDLVPTCGLVCNWKPLSSPCNCVALDPLLSVSSRKPARLAVPASGGILRWEGGGAEHSHATPLGEVVLGSLPLPAAAPGQLQRKDRQERNLTVGRNGHSPISMPPCRAQSSYENPCPWL